MARSTRHLMLLLLVALSLLAAATGCGDGETLLPSGTNVAPPEPDEPPTESHTSVERRIERAVFELVNDERRERGLPVLEWNDQLARLAQEWSRQMADESGLQHQDGERMLERSEGFTIVGENIFRATGPVPASTIHVGWMRSDGHRANVLQPMFNRIGVGVVCTPDGAVWATQRFGGTVGAGVPEPTADVPPEQPIVADEGQGPTCPGGRRSGHVLGTP